MYEYLLNNLITKNQVNDNLKRTAQKGLISKLSRKQLCSLALKYFGVDEEGNFTEDINKIEAYMCPYSGNIIDDVNKIDLEHIISVNKNGGTVLFNCIPASKEANGSKNGTPLLSWWTKNNYFSIERLERLLNYMLEAYSLAFTNDSEEENEETLYELNDEEKAYSNDDMPNTKEENVKYIDSMQEASYLQFIISIIKYLEKNNIDCKKYKSSIDELEQKGIFENVKNIEITENIVQDVLENIIEDKNKCLAYSLNIDMNRLYNSIKENNDIERVLKERLDYIDNILRENNISIIDYFENLKDIEEYNLLYVDINKINDKEKFEFVENIKIGPNTKLQYFIDMLRRAESDEEIGRILESKTDETFKKYIVKDGKIVKIDTKVRIGKFYGNHNKEIKDIINKDDRLKERLQYYYVDTPNGQNTIEGINLRTKLFLNMLRAAKTLQEMSNILNYKSNETFKEYRKKEDGEWAVYRTFKSNINGFWHEHKNVLMPIIEHDKELNSKMFYYFVNELGGQQSKEGKKIRKEIVINLIKMIKNEDDIANLSHLSNIPFIDIEGNDSIIGTKNCKVGAYLQNNKNDIMNIINNDEELKKIYIRYCICHYNGQKTEDGKQMRLETFANMIKYAKSDEEIDKIIMAKSSKRFTTYKLNKSGKIVKKEEYCEIKDYWQNNREKIINYINNSNDEILIKKFNDYIKRKEEKVNIFVDMIRHAKSNDEIATIMYKNSEATFKLYKQNEKDGKWYISSEFGKVRNFWGNHKDEIRKLIFNDEELNKKYIRYCMTSKGGQKSEDGVNKRIEILIDMIRFTDSSKEVKEILKARSKRKFISYKQNEEGIYYIDEEYDEIGYFYHDHYQQIISKLIEEEKYKNSEYDKAREYFLNYINENKRKYNLPEYESLYKFIDADEEDLNKKIK